MFDDHFREIKTCKNVAPYCYFSISFYLVEIGKVPQTVKLYKRMVSVFFNTDNDNNRLKRSDLNLNSSMNYRISQNSYKDDKNFSKILSKYN